MPSNVRLSAAILVAFVALTLGPCPCVLAGSFPVPVEHDTASGGPAKPSCCHERSPEPGSGSDQPADSDDCPCCKYVGAKRLVMSGEASPLPAELPFVAILVAQPPRLAVETTVRARPAVEHTLGPPAERRAGTLLQV